MSQTMWIRPPQQARSRAALQRILTSAEQVLIDDGFEEFTIARVAEHAGVSVGGIYRRFAGKEQLIEAVAQDLLNRLEDTIRQALEPPQPSVRGVLDAFTAALGDLLAANGRLIPALLGRRRGPDTPAQGLRTLTGLHHTLRDALDRHIRDIARTDPDVAIAIAFRSMMAAGLHRAAVAAWWPDGLTWPQWAREIADMTTSYLAVEEH